MPKATKQDTSFLGPLITATKSVFSETGLYMSAEESQSRFDAKINEITKGSDEEIKKFFAANKDLKIPAMLNKVKEALRDPKISNNIVLTKKIELFEQLINTFQEDLKAIDAEKDPDLFLKIIKATRNYENGLRTLVEKLKSEHPDNNELFDKIHAANMSAIDAFAKKTEYLKQAKMLTHDNYSGTVVSLMGACVSFGIIGFGVVTLPIGGMLIALGVSLLVQASTGLCDIHDSEREAKFLVKKATGKVGEQAEYKSMWKSFSNSTFGSSCLNLLELISPTIVLGAGYSSNITHNRIG